MCLIWISSLHCDSWLLVFFALSLHAALWHCNTLETFAVQGSRSAILRYIAGTALPAEFTPGEAEEQDLCVHQTGNMDLQQD